MSKKILFLSAVLIIGASFFAGVQLSLAEEATAAPTITVLSPNGGEVLEKGKPATIKWSTTLPSTSNVLIELRYGITGTDISQIAEASSSLGSYIWIPSTTTNSGTLNWIRISDGATTYDSSDAPFTIVASDATQTISGTATLVGAGEDKVFKWAGNDALHTPDWKWSVSLTNPGSTAKTIKRMVIAHNVLGEGWATDDSTNNPVNKSLYLLGTTRSQSADAPVFNIYTGNLGYTLVANSTINFYAYGANWLASQKFNGGYLTVYFTDDTSAKITIPASDIVPGSGGAVCTTDVKLCPDGTYVSRFGPSCQFAECTITTPKPYITFISISGPTSAQINTPATYQLSATASGQDTGLVYKINWGDEKVTQDVVSNSTSKNFTHQWPSSGIYTITFTASSQIDTSVYSIKTLAVKVSDTSVHTPFSVCENIPLMLPRAAVPADQYQCGSRKDVSLPATIRWFSDPKNSDYAGLIMNDVNYSGKTISVKGFTDLNNAGGDILVLFDCNKDGIFEDNGNLSINKSLDLTKIRSFVKESCSGQADILLAQNSPGYRMTISSVSLESNTSPSITVLNPNGGETWAKGTTQTIKWQVNLPMPTCTNNSAGSSPTCINFAPIFYDIWLTSGGCSDPRLACMIAPQAIAKSVASPSYQWKVGTTVNNPGVTGRYKITVCAAGSFAACDASDYTFAITVSTSIVKEQVKCVFNNSASEQKCNTKTDDTSPYRAFNCSGLSSCVVDINGINGDKLTWGSSCGGYAYTMVDGSNEYATFDCSSSNTSTAKIDTISQSASQQILDINEKSKLLSNNNFDFILAELDQLRSLVKEQQTQIKYLNSLVKGINELSQKTQDALNNFITYGVDANTQKLGAGERAAVINSYKAAFDKLPETEAELADAIKIANGRFPSVTSADAEKTATDQFVKIYKRNPDLNNANDNAAIKVMAYGLRQKAENRNLNSEKAGIKIFKNIFGSVPMTTEDWNTMQAITYSGATR